MRSITQNTLGITLIIAGVPSTAAEYDEMAGEVGACVDSAVDDSVYRGWLTKFRPAFIEALTEKSGVKKEDGEKDAVYCKRIAAGILSQEELQTVGQNVADDIEFAINYVSGGRIAKKFKDKAQELIDLIEKSKGGDYSRLVANISERNPGFKFIYDEDEKPTLESIALALKTEEERVRREAANSLTV